MLTPFSVLTTVCAISCVAAVGMCICVLLHPQQVRLYDVLFKSESPDALGDSWLDDLNPDSLEVVQGAMVNPHLAANAKVSELQTSH